MVTIFSYAQNEDEISDRMLIEGNLAADFHVEYGYKPHRREILDRYIDDFNKVFDTAHSSKDSQGFYNYYNDVAKKAKNNELDILLVANMFLTGFDSKYVNTMYVDKNLQYHGLIQAFSRTNRIFDKNKSQGNIVCFRNLKEKTDQAITLFSNKEAIDEIIVEPYETYVAKFNEAAENFLTIVPSVDDVDGLYSEEDKLQFILSFRTLMRLYNKMNHYSEFTWDDLGIDEQIFAGYTSKYLDLKDRISVKTGVEKTSILQDIDFELELIRKDTINVAYILQLLIKLKAKDQSGNKSDIEGHIFNLLGSEVSLRSKRELIEKFIQNNLPSIEDTDDIPEEFEKFWSEEQDTAIKSLVVEEGLSEQRTERLVENYIFAEREPLRDEILDLIEGPKPTILNRKKTGDRIFNKILNFVETFVHGMTGS